MESITVYEAERQYVVLMRTAAENLDMEKATAWDLICALAGVGEREPSNIFASMANRMVHDMEIERGLDANEEVE
jgi:hypothetical protein